MRPKIVKIITILCFIICFSFIYTRWVEPKWLKISENSVHLIGEVDRNFKILHISDLHASKFVSLEFIDKALSLGISQNPDLIMITGDMVTNRFTKDFINTTYFKNYTDVLSQLAHYAPTFACLGNHDGGKWAHYDSSIIKKLLKDSGITVLHNENKNIAINQQSIEIVGLGDLWAEEFKPNLAFQSKSIQNNQLRFVIVHNPDTKDLLKDYDWHILFAGHTHGGQLKLPFIGTPFAPVKDHRYIAGLKRWEEKWIHVTKGIGNLLGMRFNCRPEISIINIIVEES